MKLNKLVYRRILLDLIPPFVLNLMFFLFVFIMTKLLEITNYIVNYRVSAVKVLLMLVYSMPFFLQFVIPMAVMMAVLLVFLRMANDNEVLALKAGGVSIYGMLPPVLLFCTVGCVLNLLMSIYGVPWGTSALKRVTFELAKSSFEIAVKERKFNDNFDGVMFYVNKIDSATKTLQDVFVEDQRSEKQVSTIIAPRGRLIQDPETLTTHLKLFDGAINKVDLASQAVHLIHFKAYELKLDFREAAETLGKKRKRREEMALAELREYIRTRPQQDSHYYRALMDYYKKFSVPLGCLFLGLLALALGFQSQARKRSFGLGLGLGFFLLYQLLLSAGWSLGESGAYPPLIGMWIPNIITIVVGVVLLHRNANERSLDLSFFKFLNRTPKTPPA